MLEKEGLCPQGAKFIFRRTEDEGHGMKVQALGVRNVVSLLQENIVTRLQSKKSLC